MARVALWFSFRIGNSVSPDPWAHGDQFVVRLLGRRPWKGYGDSMYSMTDAADFSAREAVYATVRFADLSRLPITLERLHCCLIGGSLSLLETSMAVDELVAGGKLARHDDLVCLAGSEASFASYEEATRRAARAWPQAEKWGQRISECPFVRMVAVAGSLAAGALAPDDDIELFIVVRPRRLWTARRIITQVLQNAASEGVTFKPVYITTTRSLEFRPRSLPIAWELAQLVVIVGADVMRTVRRSNSWMFDLLPNATTAGDLSHHVDQVPTSTQKRKESLLLLPPLRVVEYLTRRHHTGSPRGKITSADARSSRAPSRHRRLSAETCDDGLGARAALREQAWIEGA